MQPKTSTATLQHAGHVVTTTNPFVLPRGVKGRLAGWYMSVPDAQHRELLEAIDLEGVDRLLEVGFGPGQMITALRRRSPGLDVCGVDPSELMVARARRRNPHADLHVGAAAAIPFPNHHADLVLSVNNIPMWPDLAAGMSEVARILTAQGKALFAWHGGTDPRGHQRRLVLSPDRLQEIELAIRAHFTDVSARRLHRSELWEASGAKLPATD
ncbi:MAG TPA: methyltransferase domain-containing protein [Ilumatobacteraceae bacterium]|jgi:SAM-dependent methyltransferase